MPGGEDARTPLGRYLDAYEAFADTMDGLSTANRQRHWQALQARRPGSDHFDAGVRTARAILDTPPFGQVPLLLAACAVPDTPFGRTPFPLDVPLPRTDTTRSLVAVVRDVFGNPFRPVAFASEWRTSNAVGVARAMYAARDFTAAPILADALEDAGCDAADLLAHLRDPAAVHARGCWALDLVLGKS